MLLGSWDVKEMNVPADWKEADFDMLVPYLVSVHLLYDEAKARDQQSVLILPPHGMSVNNYYFNLKILVNLNLST